MSHRRRRLAARFLAIGLFAATLFTVDSLAASRPAEARCIGEDNPVQSWWKYLYVVRATETAGFDTCDKNNYYTGFLKDESADGYCVSVWFLEADLTSWQLAGRVCGVGKTVSVTWQDRNGNSTVYEQFCVDPVSNPRHYICGWGNGLDNYATNYGY